MVKRKKHENYISKTAVRIEARINYDKSHIEQTSRAYHITMSIVKEVYEFNRGKKTTYFEKVPLQKELTLNNPTLSRARAKVKTYLKEHKYDPSLPIEFFGRRPIKTNLTDKVKHAISSKPLYLQE